MTANPSAVGEVPTSYLVRNQAGMIIDVDDAITELLGWRPADLINAPSTTFIHSEDQPSAIAAWFAMLEQPGGTNSWEGRYRTAAGDWQWVRVTNTNRLDDEANPRVLTTLTAVTVERAGLAEELRSRKQLLNRLSDALPVGLVQFDTERAVTFTNDRLHTLLATPPAATVDAQLAAAIPDDAATLAAAIDTALCNEPVDRVEVRFDIAGTDGDDSALRVCELTLRPLNDEAGSVTGVIGCLSDVTDSVRLRGDLQLRATTDALTGCLNRAATLDYLTELLAEPGDRSNIMVAYLDVDHFKAINDHHGHQVGDAVLVVLAEQLRSVLRDGDRVGRLGGDEMVVVCPRVAAAAVQDITGRLRAATHGFVLADDTPVSWQASLGVAWSADHTTTDDLIAQADRDMYANKRRRRSDDDPSPAVPPQRWSPRTRERPRHERQSKPSRRT